MSAGARSDLDDFPIHQPSPTVQQPAAQLASADPKAVAARAKAPSDLHVLPPTAVAWCVEALRNGAIDKDYGVRNWRERSKERPGIELTTYLDAIGRHLMQIQEGEDFTSDSHILHLAHVMAGCAILIDARACGTLIDNRTCGNVEAFDRTQEAIKQIRRLRAALAVMSESLIGITAGGARIVLPRRLRLPVADMPKTGRYNEISVPTSG